MFEIGQIITKANYTAAAVKKKYPKPEEEE